MTISELLQQIHGYKIQLAGLLSAAVAINHKITAARDYYKVTEDAVIAEIWLNESYKNDKQRNEQKHLAKINDARLIEPMTVINQLEMDKAGIHADILLTQNDLQLATIQYQAAMLNAPPLGDVMFKLVAVEKEGADTSKSVELDTALSHPVVGEEPVPATADFICGKGETGDPVKK